MPGSRSSPKHFSLDRGQLVFAIFLNSYLLHKKGPTPPDQVDTAISSNQELLPAKWVVYGSPRLSRLRNTQLMCQ